MSGFLKPLLCMAGDLFGVRAFSVPLLKQPGHVPVFVGTGAWPKHSGLYVEGSVPDASSLQTQSDDMALSTARFREGVGSLAGQAHR